MIPHDPLEIAGSVDEWVIELNELEGRCIILVEGKKDVAALVSMGVKRDVMPVNQGLSMIEFVESLVTAKGPFEGRPRYEMVVIMTDWDMRGGKLARSLGDACTMADVRSDLDFRRRIAVLTGKWIKSVESLPSLIENLRGHRSDHRM